MRDRSRVNTLGPWSNSHFVNGDPMTSGALKVRFRRPQPALLLAATLSLGVSGACDSRGPGSDFPAPLDRQVVQDQDDMTWDDYRPIPGVNWADPALVPERGFKIAVVAIDFPDQPFVVTLPRGSDPFGNPQIDPIDRGEVPQF